MLLQDQHFADFFHFRGDFEDSLGIWLEKQNILLKSNQDEMFLFDIPGIW